MGGERPRGGIETDSEAFDFQFLLSINACKKNVCHRVSGECFFFFFFFFFIYLYPPSVPSDLLDYVILLKVAK